MSEPAPSAEAEAPYNPYAITALVAAIVGILGLAIVAWPVAGIAGRAATDEFAANGESAGRGEWMARTGVVVGWIWAVLAVVAIAFIYATGFNS